MRVLYLFLLLATFFGGIYDNGDMTAFVFLLMFGIGVVISDISDKLKRNKRRA